jgi:hypothetical protein
LILRHVTGFVNFALVIDLDVDWDTGWLFFGDTGAADTVCIVVQNVLFIVSSVFWGFKWDFDLIKQKVKSNFLVHLRIQSGDNFARRLKYGYRWATFRLCGLSHMD